jgi:hypothetical protein
MSDDPVWRLSGGLAWYEAELPPAATLSRAFADLQVRIDALNADPYNEELHDACDAKLAHVARLTDEPGLGGEIRVAARHQVMETARWLASMPVARKRLKGANIGVAAHAAAR